MFERLTINLTSQEREAIELIANSEMRDLRHQIRYVLRQELESRGLLPSDKDQIISDPKNNKTCDE
jgi:hypothetical protein